MTDEELKIEEAIEALRVINDYIAGTDYDFKLNDKL